MSVIVKVSGALYCIGEHYFPPLCLFMFVFLTFCKNIKVILPNQTVHIFAILVFPQKRKCPHEGLIIAMSLICVALLLHPKDMKTRSCFYINIFNTQGSKVFPFFWVIKKETPRQSEDKRAAVLC